MGKANLLKTDVIDLKRKWKRFGSLPFLLLLLLTPFCVLPPGAAATEAPCQCQSTLSPDDIRHLLEQAESSVQTYFSDARENRVAGHPTDYSVLEPAILHYYTPTVDWKGFYLQEFGSFGEAPYLFPFSISIKSSLLVTENHPNQVTVQFKVPAGNGETEWDEHLETVTLLKKETGWVIDSQVSSPLIDGFTEAEMETYVNQLYSDYVGAPLHFRFEDNRDYVFSGTNAEGKTFTFHANKKTGLVQQWF